MYCHGDHGITLIHPTAIVDPRAQLASDVEIGPYAIVESGVICESGVKIGPRAFLREGLYLSAGVEVHAGAVLAGPPQDLKFRGAPSFLKIGANTIVREYCTLNRAVAEGAVTEIGHNCLIMAYVHLGHDCLIGNHVILSNKVQIGGHVQIGDHSVLGGCTAIHQFSKIGAFCFVGGTLKVDRDVPIGSKALGDPLSWAGLNYVGLRRSGISEKEISELEQMYRLIYKSGISSADAHRTCRDMQIPWFDEYLHMYETSVNGMLARKK